jgi:hypothetical protein
MENKDKLKCKVILLPTKGASQIGLFKSGTLLYYKGYTRKEETSQHLYFVSDREIKEGDWTMNKQYKEVEHITVDIHTSTCGCKKIEATTDALLNLPLIPQSFIAKFVEEQGNIKEVLLDLDD